MKILILEGLHGDNKGKKMQWRLKRTNLKVGDRVVLDCHDWKVIKVVEKKKSKGDLRGVNPKGAIFSEYDIGHEIPEYMKPLLKALEKPGKWLFVSPRKHPSIMQIMEQRLLQQQEERKTEEKKKLSELRNRPYFKTVVTEVKGKPSRGENLEKIKFPCWCIYGGSMCGMITRTKANEAFDNEFYTLHSIKKQYSSVSSVRSYYSLEDLIRVWNIEILKGELHLWREV